MFLCEQLSTFALTSERSPEADTRPRRLNAAEVPFADVRPLPRALTALRRQLWRLVRHHSCADFLEGQAPR
jgi:hypothetical protein